MLNGQALEVITRLQWQGDTAIMKALLHNLPSARPVSFREIVVMGSVTDIGVSC